MRRLLLLTMLAALCGLIPLRGSAAGSQFTIVEVHVLSSGHERTASVLLEPATGRTWILADYEAKNPAWYPLSFQYTPGLPVRDRPPAAGGVSRGD